MKKFFCTAILMIAAYTTCVAQEYETLEVDDDYKVLGIVKCENTKNQLYDATLEWVERNVRNYQNLRIREDKERGLVRFSWQCPFSHTVKLNTSSISYNGKVTFVCSVTVKDKKLRIQTDNMVADIIENALGRSTPRLWTLKSLMDLCKDNEHAALSGLQNTINGMTSGIMQYAVGGYDDF